MVETGYENLLLVRLLLEMRIPSIRKSSVGIQRHNPDLSLLYEKTKNILCHVYYPQELRNYFFTFKYWSGSDNCGSTCKVAEGLTVDGILENWSKIKPVIMEEWAENRDALIELFGKVRDEWMDNDLATWIGANRYFN